MRLVKSCAKKVSEPSGKERWPVCSAHRHNLVSHWSRTNCCSAYSMSISVAQDRPVRMWNMRQHWTAKRWNWIQITLVAIVPPFHCWTASKRNSDSVYRDSHRPFNWSPARDRIKNLNLFISMPHNQSHRNVCVNTVTEIYIQTPSRAIFARYNLFKNFFSIWTMYRSIVN